MRLVVGLDLLVAHRDRGVGDGVARDDGGQADLHRLVLVAIALPQRGVGEIHVGGDQAEQLAALDLLPVLRLEGGQVLLGHARREPPLVLAHVELTVGLELGHVPELGRRRGADRVHDLVLADGDPAARVFLVEDAVLDELLPDLIAHLLDVLQPEARGRLALAIVDGLLDHPLVGAGIHALAIDVADGGSGEQAGIAGDPAQVDDEPGEEGDGQDHHEGFGRIAESLHVGCVRSAGARLTGSDKLKRANIEAQAGATIGS